MKKGEHPNSRANLALGGKARNQGKEEHCITVLPETWAWLISGKNASGRIDEIVGKQLRGEMIGLATHQKALDEIARLKAENFKLKRINGQLIIKTPVEVLAEVEAIVTRLEAQSKEGEGVGSAIASA